MMRNQVQLKYDLHHELRLKHLHHELRSQYKEFFESKLE